LRTPLEAGHLRMVPHRRRPVSGASRLFCPLLLGTLSMQACASAVRAPEWASTPVVDAGAYLTFVGRAEGTAEAEARDAALQSARQAAAQAQMVRIESDLRVLSGQAWAAASGDSVSFAWQRVASTTRERAASSLRGVLPYGPVVVSVAGGRFVAWARIRVERGVLFPWSVATAALGPRGDATSTGLLRAASELETRGEVQFAELALLRAIEAADSASGSRAIVTLAWFLQRQGRIFEATRALSAVGDPLRLAPELREEIARLRSLLSSPGRDFAQYETDLLRLVEPRVSSTRLRLQAIFSEGTRSRAAGAQAELPFLLDVKEAPAQVAVLWLDSSGVGLELPAAEALVARGAHGLTLTGRRGAGVLTVIAIAAADVSPLRRLRPEGEGLLVPRWQPGGREPEQMRQREAVFQGVLEAVRAILTRDSGSAAATVSVRLQ